MQRLSSYILAKATGRNVLIALALLAVCIAVFNVWLTPQYQRYAAGFVPFDLQFPLTREMIVIQLGAMSAGAPGAYVMFAALDMAFPLVAAGFTALLWGWLALKSGAVALVEGFRRGWWIWALFPAVFDIAENVYFLTILLAYPEPRLEAIEAAILAHRGKQVFLGINQAATAALAVAAAVSRWRGGTPG
jgi:hypothetical protein